jgi:hypothetical protein
MIAFKGHVVNLCILWIVGFGYVQAQDSVTKIEVKAQAQGETIKLRWAPSDALGWSLLNKYGYTIERLTIISGETLAKPIKNITIADGLRPAPLDTWAAEAKTNDFAAVAAQSIYGDEFEIGAASTDILTMINVSQEQVQRFSFALVAADQSWQVAKLAALGFEDSTVTQDEKYLYKIFGNIPQDLYKIDTGYVYIGLRDTADLPDAPMLMAKFMGKTVELKWVVQGLKEFYNSYVIERSFDGDNFNLLSGNANMLTSTERIPKSAMIIKIDSLPASGGRVFYRLRGKSAFGEMGPPSNVVSGTITATHDFAIEIVTAQNVNDGVMIGWEISGIYQDSIDCFIQRSDYSEGTYETLNQTPVKLEQKYFLDNSPVPTGYYRIVAKIDGGNQINSFPYLMQLMDSVPPNRPEYVRASIDRLGHVKVTWRESSGQDLSGYRVYRSNFSNAEFSQLTREPGLDTVFYDTISVNTLTREAYYFITALDSRYNQSAPSNVIKVRRPDRVAPVPPVLKSVSVLDSGIKIEWINSSSKDVSEHLLYRAGIKEHWSLIRQLSINADDQGVWVDRELPHSGIYQYRLVSVDSSRNKSHPTKTITVRYNKNQEAVQVSNLKGYVDRKNKQVKLEWVNPSVKLSGVLIYRSVNGGSMSLMENIDGLANTYIDRNLSAPSSYIYGVRVIEFGKTQGYIVLSDLLNY